MSSRAGAVRVADGLGADGLGRGDSGWDSVGAGVDTADGAAPVRSEPASQQPANNARPSPTVTVRIGRTVVCRMPASVRRAVRARAGCGGRTGPEEFANRYQSGALVVPNPSMS